MAHLWSGRFDGDPDAELIAWGASFSFDRRLFQDDVTGSIAWSEGLERADWNSLDDIIEHPISWDLDLFNLRGAPYPEAAQGTWVTRGYMAAFGVEPAMGRAFMPSDFEAAGPPDD